MAQSEIERDAQGYPRAARRRLTNRDDAGTVTDIDTGQRFKVRKTKGGDRVVPLFDERVQWKSVSGYDALRLCLSCLGAPGEFVLWDEVTGAEMTREEWCKRKFCATSTPSIRHACGQIIQTTTISNIQGGQRVGCPCTVASLNLWSDRYTEFKALVPSGYTLQLTEDEWKSQCTGSHWCPPILCNCHKIEVSTTSIGRIQNSQRVGCPKCVPALHQWSRRYGEFVGIVPTGYTLELSEDEWKAQCTSAHWCPPLRCNAHGTTTTNTSVNFALALSCALAARRSAGEMRCASMKAWSISESRILTSVSAVASASSTSDTRCRSVYSMGGVGAARRGGWAGGWQGVGAQSGARC